MLLRSNASYAGFQHDTNIIPHFDSKVKPYTISKVQDLRKLSKYRAFRRKKR